MNHLPIISSYEVKTSRNELKVPVVNGVHLHSIYNPSKEAENLISNNLDSLKQKNEVLVLGLGFAYHINSLHDKMTEIHGNNFKIIVIEPNNQVYQDCLKLDLINKKNVLVYSAFTAEELYRDLELIHFLLRKPAMIAHPASFNLYQVYFKTFLTFEAPTQLEQIIRYTQSAELKNYFEKFGAGITFDQAIYEQLPVQDELSSMDFLAMALVEMTKRSELKNFGDPE